MNGIHTCWLRGSPPTRPPSNNCKNPCNQYLPPLHPQTHTYLSRLLKSFQQSPAQKWVSVDVVLNLISRQLRVNIVQLYLISSVVHLNVISVHVDVLVSVVKDSGCRKRQGVTQNSVDDLEAQWGQEEFKSKDLEETINNSGTAVFDEDGKSGKDYEKIEGNNQLEWDTPR